MAKLYVTVGLPGSGKTTWAKSQNLKVYSSDSIREELYGDEAIQGDGKKVFEILHQRVKESLAAGDSCVFDATNVSRRGRRDIVKKFQKNGNEVIAVYFNISLMECLRRNANRKRKVPAEVILNMNNKMTPPIAEEGWNKILEIKD